MTKEQILNQIRKNRVDRENQMLKELHNGFASSNNS